MKANAEPPISAAAFARYVGALREGDARVVREVITGQLERGVPLRHVCRDYIQEGLYEIGRLWERNEIPVAVEHLAASATQLVLSELYMKQKVALPHSPEVIIACVPGLDVLIGGQALDGTPEASQLRESLLARHPRVRYLGTLDELEHALTLLAGGVRPFAGP